MAEAAGDTKAPRLESLDALRGLAALSVVFWHWQHFWLLGTPLLTWRDGAEPDRTLEPLHPLLKIFYEYGHRAVDLFFVISGFVFFFLYQKAIAQGAMSGGKFAALRFSRLYPMHLATLIAVAVLQALFLHATGQHFVYEHNDAAHFTLNLFFINLMEASGFNGPTWSLTVEIAMYAVFWALARAGALRGVWGCLAVFAIGIGFWFIYPPLGRGLCGFFAGGLIYKFYQACVARADVKRIARGAVALAATSWAGLVFLVYRGAPAGLLNHLPAAAVRFLSHAGMAFIICYVVFPITVLAAALCDRLARPNSRALRLLGQISYSSYLLHFPLQLLIALACVNGVLSLGLVHSAGMLLAFFVILIPLSALAYARFEMPAQRALRKLLLHKPATAPDVLSAPSS
jgi:peptidoglycan/LPS O-acetylase OafA/YrhL